MAEPDADSHDPASAESAGGVECARCGALLPEGDEGICAMCGMPFGFKTREMPVINEEYLAKMGIEPPKKVAGARSDAPFMPASQQIALRSKTETSHRPKLVAIGVLVVVLALLMVLLAVLLGQ